MENAVVDRLAFNTSNCRQRSHPKHSLESPSIRWEMTNPVNPSFPKNHLSFTAGTSKSSHFFLQSCDHLKMVGCKVLRLANVFTDIK